MSEIKAGDYVKYVGTKYLNWQHKAYLEENGKPYYYSDTNMICGYELQS